MAPAIVLLVITFFVLFFIFYKRPKKKVALPPNYKELLTAHVAYYNRLGKEGKRRFEDKIKEFLGYVRIDGIDTTVDDLDKLLVASSAVIPIFGFDKWQYYNLRNVLLYPASFNRDQFLAAGYEKNTLGMIGNGPMQRVMILSKPALHHGFSAERPKQNTGIHEFVHLLQIHSWLIWLSILPLVHVNEMNQPGSYTKHHPWIKLVFQLFSLEKEQLVPCFLALNWAKDYKNQIAFLH